MKRKASKKIRFPMQKKKKVHAKQFLLESNILVNSELYAPFQNNSLNFFTTGQISFNFLFQNKKSDEPPCIIAVVVMVIPSDVFQNTEMAKKSFTLWVVKGRSSKKVIPSFWRFLVLMLGSFLMPIFYSDDRTQLWTCL